MHLRMRCRDTGTTRRGRKQAGAPMALGVASARRGCGYDESESGARLRRASTSPLADSFRLRKDPARILKDDPTPEGGASPSPVRAVYLVHAFSDDRRS
jgi:hypothetical protein